MAAKNILPSAPANADESWHMVVEQPKTGLRQMVGKGMLDPRAVTRAERRMETILGETDPSSWSGESMQRIQTVLTHLRSGNPLGEAEKSALIESMFDLKGLGGCFGYDLVTGIAHNLYRCLMWGSTPPNRLVGIIDAHCDAIKAVFSNKIMGQGGAVGNDLLNSLSALVGPIEEPKPPPRPPRENASSNA